MYNKFFQKIKIFSYPQRAKVLEPLLSLLAKFKITPDDITTFRLIFIIPIIYCFYQQNLTGIAVFYIVFWLFDLLDGDLARYLKQTSDRGRFFDTLVDNFVYSLIIIGFIYLEPQLYLILAFHVLIQLAVQVLAIVKKQAKKKSDWIINAQADIPYVKSLGHLFLFLYWIGWNQLPILFTALNIWLAILAVYYYLMIKKQRII